MGAALAGAQPIVAIDPVAFKRELALELGATAALHPDEVGDLRVRYAFEAAGQPAVLGGRLRARRRAAARRSRSASPTPRAS